MQQPRLNLGILAHVDAGKTTLTERLLHAAGVIDAVGSVDAGTTQTDSLAIERRRGITVRSAVASFEIDGLTVNLIDTPGHPDFIAEVERVLGVLDGAVVVVSAVEGVQAQTRVLMRALQRLRVPTLIFVNKIDRMGARPEAVLREMERRLVPGFVAMTVSRAPGARAADVTVRGPDDSAFRARLTEVLADHDAGILAQYVEDATGVPYRRLREALAAQTRSLHVHPVFFGSAMTGAGVEALMSGLTELLPAAAGDPEAPVSARVFKIERRPDGRPVALVRMFSGSIKPRDRVRFGEGSEGRVTAVEVVDRGAHTSRGSVAAGEIGVLWGLAGIRVGDHIGVGSVRASHRFPPPGLESVVVAVHPGDRGRLRVALGQLAEQDPLIDVRQDDSRDETSVSLYGEVQKEVIQATLSDDFGIEVTFHETTTICIERPRGPGEATEILRASTPTNVVGRSSAVSDNPFTATLGLRIEPAPIDAGIEVRLDTDVRLVPAYVYGTVCAFVTMMEQYVRQALQEGLYGWQVTDCVVTVIESGYRSPESTAADFRKLTQLVLGRALVEAGSVVCQPMTRATVEAPVDTVGAVLGALARLGGTVHASAPRGDLSVVEATLPTARLNDLQRQLPALTGGEGVVETAPAGHEPVRGGPTSRPQVSRGSGGGG